MAELLGGLLLGTAVSGILPLLNAEVLVAGVVVAAPQLAIPVVAVVSAAGQMTTKSLLFGLARWAPERLTGKARVALDRACAALDARGGAARSLVFASAAAGVPPFYGVSLAAGALGMKFRPFLLSGGAGRIVRFAVVAWSARHVGHGVMDFLASVVPMAVGAGA